MVPTAATRSATRLVPGTMTLTVGGAAGGACG